MSALHPAARTCPEIRIPLDDPSLPERIGAAAHETLMEELELLEMAGDVESRAVPGGRSDAVLLRLCDDQLRRAAAPRCLVDTAPPPAPRPTIGGARARARGILGFIFKIQANMNPRHRDRIAFMRVVSGRFERGMTIQLARNQKRVKLAKPHSFMASERSIVEDAMPGDIVGLYDPGEFRIGDTLYVGDRLEFLGIPRFAPEHFARIRLKDPTRRKHLKNGLHQLSQEGTVQLFYREGLGDADPYVGAVGLLQFEVSRSVYSPSTR